MPRSTSIAEGTSDAAVRGVAPETTDDDPPASAPSTSAPGRPSSVTRMAAMWAGVVPQQPPTIRAPASSSRGTIDAEVGGLGRVDEVALEALRQAGVGHDRAGRLAVDGRAEADQGVEAGERPDAAVDADRVHARLGQGSDRDLGRRAVRQDDVLAERHRGDDRHVRRSVGLVDGEQEVVEVEERLEDEEVDAALEEPVDLLPDRRADRRLVGMPQLAGRRPERTDAAAHPRVAPADVACLPRDLRRAPVEPAA